MATINVKKRIIHSTIYILSGTAAAQGLRLLTNLILTRLLMPEFFGLMAILNVLMMAIGLFSDIGIGPGVIRSKRGFEPDFLNTAWSLQIARGLVLWLATLMISYPAALFYETPSLCYLLPVTGINFIITGFDSMMIAKLNKELKLKQVVIMNLGSQIISVITMIFLAYFFRNIWSLVIGGIIGAFSKMWFSHLLVKEFKHKIRWEPTAAKELISFGKWIFLSTAMMFLATQADRIILGKLFPLGLLGIYSIALGFAELPKFLINTISENIIFPIFSIYSSLPREQLRTKIINKRRLILAPMAFLVSIFFGFGDYLIYLLYDNRYHEAGWILPILAIGMWPLLLYASIDRILYVVDNPRYPAYGNCLKFLYMFTFLPIAYSVFGKFAAVIVVALNDIPIYLAINYGLHKKKVSCFQQDFWATLFLFLCVILILAVRYKLGLGLPGGIFYN